MRLLLGLLVYAVCMTAGGCSTHSPPGTGTPPDTTMTQVQDDPMPRQNERSGIGTITYLDLEGGFYGLVTDDGEKYDPLALEEAFQQDGLRVRFRVRVRTDVMTIRMWGTPVEVIEMERYGE